MSTRPDNEPDDWYAANQRELTSALAAVRDVLEQSQKHGDDPTSSEAGSQDTKSSVQTKTEKERQENSPQTDSSAEAAVPEQPVWSALDRLCAIFGLTAFERALLLLCAGIELDSKFAPLCAAAHGDARRAHPTFSLALSVLPEPHWSALRPTGALRRWRLIEVGAGQSLTTSPLRIDERTLHFLTGVGCLDERLHGLVRPSASTEELPPSQYRLAQHLADLWRQPSNTLVQVCGNDPAGACAVAAAACAELGIQLFVLNATDLPIAAAEREAFVRLWEREAIMSNGALLIECEDSSSHEASPALTAFLEAVQSLVVVASREPLRLRHRTVRRLEVNKPSSSEQRTLWRKVLGASAQSMNGQVESATAQFNLNLQAINDASREVLEHLSGHAGHETGALLWEACRAQSRPRMDDLAQRIEPKAAWDDLVLPPTQMQALRNVAVHVRRRARVYDDWGFADKCARGLGISALFSGASGTGKTMAAEVLAGELHLDLYRIDLSAMVSKYIGETEKNLRRVFDAAEDGGAILLFDEADALFGKRSDVKDSHDRYANIEVSYLLQRMETYRGLAVLTTNMKSALDKAFLRRLRFIVQFPFPDAAQRAEIWRRIFPIQTPTEGLDAAKLARLNLAGGNIRNIALNATFLAADAGEEVRMTHLLSAARSEYAKLEKSLTDVEVGGWV